MQSVFCDLFVLIFTIRYKNISLLFIMNPQIYKMRAAIAAKNNKKIKEKKSTTLIMPKTLNTYMGSKGYTISKSEKR